MTDNASTDTSTTDSDSPAPVKTVTETTETASAKDPVRQWTIRVLLLCVILLAYYLAADRITPLSTQARVHALVVPIAPQVAGTVTAVAVSNNQVVKPGDLLFSIDDRNYRLALASAEANLQTARQGAGASAASVTAAEAGVKSAQANLDRAAQDTVRLRRIKSQDSGAISDRRIESAEAALIVAQQQLEAAKANLEQARQNLGDEGDFNSRVQQAIAAVDQAKVNLERTAVVAPTSGVVTDVRVDSGSFAAAGAPQMTFIATDEVWVQADFTENNLGHVERGDTVEIAFDVFPGRVFDGKVRATGFGVAVDSAPLGSLPTIQNNRQWLREAQRFPVIVEFELAPEEMGKLKVGAQASVMIYADDGLVLNSLGKLSMRISSLLSYLY
jgi:multidrug resistance efflux pump